MKLRVSNELLSGVKASEKEKYKEYLSHNKELLDRIKQLMEKKLSTSETAMRAKEAYDKAAWPYYHATLLGEQRVLAKLISILTLDREE